MSRPTLFVELFAGSAAVSLALIRPGLRPPVAYMGAKTSLASAILAAIGLRPGDGADAFLLCDAGPWGWAWQALAEPETCRAVAAVLRSWKDEHPKALWDRLAATVPPKDLVERAATVLWLQGRTASCCPLVWTGEWQMGDLARKGAKRVVQRSEVPLVQAQGLHQRGEPSTTHGGGLRSVETVAARLDTIAESVATWLCLSGANNYSKPVDVRSGARHHCGYGHLSRSAVEKGFKARLHVGQLAQHVSRLDEPLPPLAVVHADIDEALALLPDNLDGVVVYMDPPYVGCTTYAAGCARERVIEIALDLDRRGAAVAVSEACPLDIDGWNHLDLTPHHGGHWTTRKVKTEWLTLNRVPRAMPGALGLPIR